MFSILVTEFSHENCPFSNREHSWKQFHTFRNAVMDILSSYGSVGTMGKMPILDTCEESTDEWRLGAKDPDFFVVDVWPERSSGSVLESPNQPYSKNWLCS